MFEKEAGAELKKELEAQQGDTCNNLIFVRIILINYYVCLYVIIYLCVYFIWD